MNILERLRDLATAVALNSKMETKHGETADIAYTIIEAAQKVCAAWNENKPDTILGERINELNDLLN